MALGTLISVTAFAQPLSLDDCIRLAVQNNVQVQNGRLDIKSTEYRIKELKSDLLPTGEANGQYMYYSKLPVQYAPASAFGGTDGEYTPLTLSMRQSTQASLQFHQTIFSQEVFTGLRAARVARDASFLQLELTREDVIYNVTSTFYNIQVLNDNLKRLEDNISNLEKTVNVNASLKENELIADNTHNRLLINLENLRNEHENQKLVQHKNVTLLKYLMNVKESEEIEVTTFDYAETLANAERGDITQRPDIRLQHAQVKLAKYDKKSIAAGYFPTLSASGVHGWTSYYNSFAPTKSIGDDWMRSSYYTLNLRIPLFDGFRKQNQLRQKEIAIQKNMNTLSMIESHAEKEVEDAMTNYASNKNLLVSNKKSLDLAEQLFQSTQSEYASGLTSMTELLNAQNDLSNARTNYSMALLNLKLAELSLKKANGSLVSDYVNN
jgi:outer membrane protein